MNSVLFTGQERRELFPAQGHELTAVKFFGIRDARHLQDRRRQVYDINKSIACLSDALDSQPVDDQRGANPTFGVYVFPRRNGPALTCDQLAPYITNESRSPMLLRLLS